MFVDTSAFVALLVGDADAPALIEALEGARRITTSPLVRLEAAAVLSTRLDISPSQAEALFDELVAEAQITVAPITDAVGKLAAQCFATYGKGRHRSRLNVVDCFSYACAKVLREPLLFKGDDFAQTDLARAPASSRLRKP